MDTGEGMAISEFSYPLFQAYDWWAMYQNHGVQLQIGGSDQYGNICAGMDTVSHMRKIQHIDSGAQSPQDSTEDALMATYGLTTPLLTTASGEKFGKSAGNAVWLDPQMMSSFDLYQYFLRTADSDVERYLKLFTFLPIEQINILMGAQRRDESKRLAQHILAKELVELVHGAHEASKAEMAHKDAFGQGTNTFSLGALRSALEDSEGKQVQHEETTQATKQARELLEYKMSFITSPISSTNTTSSTNSTTTHKTPPSTQMVTLPLSFLKPSSFPTLLHLTGLCTSRSEAHRLIASKGAYIVLPNSGTSENPGGLKWIAIENAPGADPKHFLVDYRALVLRVGKSKVRIVRVVRDEDFAKDGS